MQIEILKDPVTEADKEALGQLLRACIEGGASIGFLLATPPAEQAAYWKKVLAETAAGGRLILVARLTDGGPIVGSVQLALEARANGRHRAEVQKLMVLPSQRRGGLARRLMARLEEEAARRQVRILHLDTSEGPGGACGFYESIGYLHAGGIPDYALDPDGTPRRNAFYYRRVGD